MPPESKARLFGVRLDRLSWAELDNYCQHALLEDSPKQLVTANGEILLKAADDKKYAETLNGADLVIPESTNVAWVLALKGFPVKNITPGADLVNRLARIAAKNQKSIFLLGAEEGIADKAASKLRQTNPGLKIAGCSNSDPDNPYVSKQIRDSEADVVLVAYGAPAQEKWIATHKRELGAKILVGIGGVFDMLAGLTPRAPRLWRVLHLEWLWRLILQPSRIGRIWRAVVIFPLKALFS